MDATTFKRQRDSLDLTIEETCGILGVAKASVTAWQSGRYRVPTWVDEKFAEVRAVRDATFAERDVRRAVEDRFANLSTKLYLGEVPDGWLPLVEEFLAEVDQHVPDHLKNGESFSLDFKEKWGSLRVSPFTDFGEDLDAGKRFWDWIEPRVEKLEADSEATCARCGSHDDVSITNSGWVLPLCKRHRLLRQGDL